MGKKKVEVIDKNKLLQVLKTYIKEGEKLIKSTIKNKSYYFAARIQAEAAVVEGIIKDIENGIFRVDTES